MKLILLTLWAIANLAYATGFDARLNGHDYPYPVKLHKFSSQGQSLEMAYMDMAPQNPSQKVIVLLHGKNFAGFYYKSVAEALLEKGYRVIIPDQIGFGKSSKPANFQYSFHLLGYFTDQLLQSIGIEKYSILAHSMGGMLAGRMALMYPQKLNQLILINPIGLEDYRPYVPYKNIDDVYAAELKVTPESIKNYQLEAYYDGKWKPEYDELIVPALGWLKHKDYPLIAKNAALTYEMIYTQPVCLEFKHITTPTVLIIGQRDRTAPGKGGASEVNRKKLGDYPRLGKITHKAIKNSKLIEVKGQGHVPFIEDFAGFKKILQSIVL